MDEKDNLDKEKYVIALEQVRYEGELLWQIFGSFLLAHTVFLAFLLQSILGKKPIFAYNFGGFLAAILGLLLCIPWFATYLRSSAYYSFRMAQAKEAEPPEWNLIRGNGEKFSAGEKIVIEGETHQIGGLARVLRTKRSVPLLIMFFISIYLIVFILSGPWWQ